MAAIAACHSSNPGAAGGASGTAGGTTGTGGAGARAGGGSTGAGGNTGAGGRNTGGSGSGAGGSGAGGSVTGTGGQTGVVTCTPGVEATLITDCGYPMASATPLSSVAFSESEVLRAIQASGGWPSANIRLFYSDEHALTLGVRQVVTKTAAGTSTMDYPVSPLPSSPASVTAPQTGTNELVGPQSGLDPSQRPMWPALFITDITSDPNARSGDWQYGGRPKNPDAIHGTWKGAVRTVDTTVTPNRAVITPDPDPMKNNWNLGGGDPVPPGLSGQGFGAEVVWNVPLTPGRSYRLQVMVHDGDQNKAGGDSGEACVIFCAGGTMPPPAADAGAPPPPMCPMGTTPCVANVDTGGCSADTVCTAGCCVPIIR
jgi:hypothetical protein